MKKILYVICLLIIFFISINVYAMNVLNFNNTKERDNKIDNIIATKDGYIIVNDKTIYSYVNNELIVQKEFANLDKINIEALQDNKYLLVGLNNKSLVAYYLDQYFRIEKSYEYDNIVNIKDIKLYVYKDKAYVLDINDGILNSTEIYEIDKDLVITENGFSSYEPSLLVNILKGDYYMIHLDGSLKEQAISYFSNSYYTENNFFLGGYLLRNDGKKEAIIEVLDNQGNYLRDIVNTEVREFKDIEFINNKVIGLANDEVNTYLYIYELDGTINDKIVIDNMVNIKKIDRIANQLYLINNSDNKAYINIYDFNCYINRENSVFGTIDVISSSNPNERVMVKVRSNSGYEVNNIIVKDNKGNIIPIDNESFIMPYDDVNISVNYTETLVNPETVDYVLVLLVFLILMSLTIVYLTKKLKWLK